MSFNEVAKMVAVTMGVMYLANYFQIEILKV